MASKMFAEEFLLFYGTEKKQLSGLFSLQSYLNGIRLPVLNFF